MFNTTTQTVDKNKSWIKLLRRKRLWRSCVQNAQHNFPLFNTKQKFINLFPEADVLEVFNKW